MVKSLRLRKSNEFLDSASNRVILGFGRGLEPLSPFLHKHTLYSLWWLLFWHAFRFEAADKGEDFDKAIKNVKGEK